jgi:hypothetical protein
MRTGFGWIVGIGLMCVLAAHAPAASSEPAAVLVHRSNPLDSITSHELRGILMGEVGRWSGRRITIVGRESTNPAYQKMLHQILRMSENDYRRALMAAEFRGESAPLIKVLNTDDGAWKFVYNVPSAIAIVNAVPAGALPSQVKVLRIDGKLPGEPDYVLQ